MNTRTAIGIVLASLLSAFISGALILAIGLTRPESSQKFYTFLSFIVGQSFMIVPLVIYLYNKNEQLLYILRIRSISLETAIATTSFSFGVIVLSDELDRIIQSIIPAPDYIVNLGDLMQPDSLVGLTMLFLAVVVIAPLGEELLFRGFLQQVLENQWKDVTRAILITSLLFSIIHMNLYWLVQIYILGILLGLLCWKTNSIFPPLILHAMNNMTALLFSIINIDIYSFYIWNGHVAPWFIFLSIVCIIVSYRKINLA